MLLLLLLCYWTSGLELFPSPPSVLAATRGQSHCQLLLTGCEKLSALFGCSWVSNVTVPQTLVKPLCWMIWAIWTTLYPALERSGLQVSLQNICSLNLCKTPACSMGLLGSVPANGWHKFEKPHVGLSSPEGGMGYSVCTCC